MKTQAELVAFVFCTLYSEGQPGFAKSYRSDICRRFVGREAVTVKNFRDMLQGAGVHVVEEGDARSACLGVPMSGGLHPKCILTFYASGRSGRGWRPPP
jgi:hypothetical protein